MTSATGMRQVEVRRLALSEELSNLVRLSTTIVLGVWLYLASSLADGPGARRNLMPYQALVLNRPAAEQRIFRELQEGLIEAERIRSTAGSWPTADALADDGIPPFALDPTTKNTRYRWQVVRTGMYINYLGVPDRAGAPGWLILVQEPEPGTPPDQPYEDEEHHQLVNGPMLHVSTWTHENGSAIAPHLVRLPQAEGWTQLYAVGPVGPRP